MGTNYNSGEKPRDAVRMITVREHWHGMFRGDRV